MALRRSILLASLIMVGLAVRCSSTQASNDASVPDGAADSTLEASADAPVQDAITDAGPPTWLSETSVTVDAGIVVEQVTYASGSLVIHGEICRPPDNGPHPLVMINHGGFYGITPMDHDDCRAAASVGWVGAVSEYRGEGSSDGKVEVCLGEVDDVLAMLAILRAQPYVNPQRVGAFGMSHGGCITASLALRDPTLKAAVDYFGPSDMAGIYDFWHGEIEAGAPYCQSIGMNASLCVSAYSQFLNILVNATGGSPSQQAAAYAARTPQYANLQVPMLVFQGTADWLVPLGQGCLKRTELASGGKPPASWYADNALQPQNPSNVCDGGFNTSPFPSSLSQSDYFFVFEDQGHGFDGGAYTQAGQEVFEFLSVHL